MWVNIHQSYHLVSKVTQKTVWSAIIMLFFSSFYPYATKLIAVAFWNKTMQGLYGIVVLLITFAVIGYYSQLGIKSDSRDNKFKLLAIHRQRWLRIDIALKCIGLVISLTIFPPATSIAVLITLLCLVIPNQLGLHLFKRKQKKYEKK